ncbi:MAG: hydrogenase maturation protease [Bryobacterales bacterium]|nr:hydrogenase maturation protease [Bryobacterales bacterium]
MKPNLVIGLGNPLMGDEGIGWHILDRLAADPRLPQDTELLWGSTDLLACAGQMEGRRRIVLIDAMLDPSHAGSVAVYSDRDGFPHLDEGQEHAHQLSAVQALRLLQSCSPGLRTVPVTLIAIAIDGASVTMELSPALSAGMPELLDRILRELAAE